MDIRVVNRIRDRELEIEIVLRGVSRDVFLAVLHQLRQIKPKPRVAIRNPDPLAFAAETVHTIRAVFENHAIKALGVYASKKAIDLIYDLAKSALTKSPKSAHRQMIEIYGPDGKRTTRKG